MAPDQHEHSSSFEQQRLPMRKPMSMVEYWVRTGYQPYMEKIIDKSFSDSGSSLEEEEIVEEENLNLSRLPVNSSLEKNYGNSLIQNKHDKTITNTSSSSVDTAIYIKANNNTTTKSETAAIIKDSKSFENKSTNPKLKNGKANIYHNHLNLTNLNITKSNNFKNFTAHKSFNENNESVNWKQNNKHVRSTPSKSDESMYRSRYFEDSHNSGTKKFQEQQLNNDCFPHNHPKRKKLYSSQDSNVEFTPVSDENRSLRILKSSSNISQHPALQTPLSHSKFLYKKKRKSLKRKSRHLTTLDSYLELKEQNKNKSPPLKNNDTSRGNLNNLSKKPISTSTYENEFKKYIEKSKLSNNNVSGESFKGSSNSSNDSHDSSNSKFKLKPFNSQLNKLMQKSNSELEVSKNRNVEKKIEINNGISCTKSLHCKNIYSVQDKYAIILSEDDDEIDVDDNNLDIVSSDDNLKNETIESSEHLDQNIDIIPKKIENVRNVTVANVNKSKKLNGMDEKKTVRKIICSPNPKKNKSKDRHVSKKIKLEKSDKKNLSIVNKPEKVVKKKEEGSENWKEKSFQIMKKIFKHTIVFSSSDESE